MICAGDGCVSLAKPNERIEEDYLRILRFYRFNRRPMVHWGGGKPLLMQKAKRPLLLSAPGLRQLSPERLGGETHQIISRSPCFADMPHPFAAMVCW